MKIKKIIKIFLICAILFSLFLVYKEIVTQNYCPLLWKIPACYIVLIGYSLMLLAIQNFENRIGYITYFIFGDILFTIAVWFSYKQIIREGNCPAILKIPLCYASLLLAATLIILGLNINKKKQKSKLETNSN